MRQAALIALTTLLVITTPAAAVARRRLPPRPHAASLLAAQPITPNGTLIRDGERVRTLELDELAPLRLRLSIPF